MNAEFICTSYSQLHFMCTIYQFSLICSNTRLTENTPHSFVLLLKTVMIQCLFQNVIAICAISLLLDFTVCILDSLRCCFVSCGQNKRVQEKYLADCFSLRIFFKIQDWHPKHMLDALGVECWSFKMASLIWNECNSVQSTCDNSDSIRALTLLTFSDLQLLCHPFLFSFDQINCTSFILAKYYSY